MPGRILVTAAALLTTIGARATGIDVPEIPCFDEFHQIYDQNDGGYMVRYHRTMCNEVMHTPLQGDPGPGPQERREEHVEVFYSAGNEREVRQVKEWVFHPAKNGLLCQAGIYVQNSTTTTVFHNGVWHESRVIGTQPPVETTLKRPQNPAPNHVPPAPHGPAASDPYFDHRGLESMVGYQCERVVSLSPLTMSICRLPLPARCSAANHVMPLHWLSTAGNAPNLELRTVSLKTGAKGSVFDVGKIAPP